MRKRSNHQKKYYFPDKLIKPLDRIPGYPLTIVELPPGLESINTDGDYLIYSKKKEAS